MINKPKKITVTTPLQNQRLDLHLAQVLPDFSRSYLQKLIKKGFISVDGITVTVPKATVSNNTEIQIDWPEEKQLTIPEGESFKFSILYEDKDVLVIDKPAGVVVHPAAGNWEGTVVNALIGKDKDFADNFSDDLDEQTAQRPGIVHRLDKDTSGCLIIVKNSYSKQHLSESFASRKVKKIYTALVKGYPQKYTERIETLIGRHPISRKKMAVVERNGKEAITIYETIKKGCIDNINISLLKIKILTGRTHQIRVHLAYRKLPVLGDEVYGGSQKLNVPRQMLHAKEITFPHPVSKKDIFVTSPYPADFQEYLTQLE